MVKKLLLLFGIAGLKGSLTSARRRFGGKEEKSIFPWWAWALIIAVPMGVFVNRLLRRRAAMKTEAVLFTRSVQYRTQVADTPVENISPVIQDVPLPIEHSPWPAAQAEKTQTVEMSEMAPASPPSSNDDLEIIEGIGPVIAGVLRQAGIVSFVQLAETDVSRLEEILREAGLRLGDPTTWPEQAALAARGDWEGLQALTNKLTGGRRS